MKKNFGFEYQNGDCTTLEEDYNLLEQVVVLPPEGWSNDKERSCFLSISQVFWEKKREKVSSVDSCMKLFATF